MNIKDIIKLINNKKEIEYIGRKYYYYKPSKKDRNVEVYQNEQIHTVKLHETKEVYTNWFKVLVNQKLDYSLSKSVTVDKNIPLEFSIEDIIDKAGLNASLDSKSWLHIYINNMKKLDWIIVNDCQIIDIWDKYNKYIENIVRFWIHNEDKEKKESEQRTHVEVWTPESLITFDIKDNKEFNVQKKNHYLEILKYQDKEEKINPKNFGFIPFIPLFNNKNKESDIEGIQVLLDVYNEISTGFINNVRQFQEMIMKLKGYGAQDIEILKDQLKRHKIIPIDEDGDIDYLKVEIPVEARSILLEICRKNIFVLGRGVDPTDNLGGGNITNVLIKSKYSNLDMKNSDMEKQIRIFYRQLILFLNTFYDLNLENEIKFNRTQIFNEAEQIDNCLKSYGLISRKTVLKNHPWVDDIEKEFKDIQSDKEKEFEEIEKQKEFDKTKFGMNDL